MPAAIARIKEVDAMRLEVSRKLIAANAALDAVKEKAMMYRKLIKNHYSPEQWITSAYRTNADIASVNGKRSLDGSSFCFDALLNDPFASLNQFYYLCPTSYIN